MPGGLGKQVGDENARGRNGEWSDALLWAEAQRRAIAPPMRSANIRTCVAVNGLGRPPLLDLTVA
jgi:hypothetical protein